jgi:hypothetical protein
MVRQREEREAVEAQKSVQITRPAHHPFPKWATNRTFRGAGLTDAADLICDSGGPLNRLCL